MRDNVQRPKAEKRKIHSKNEFELCYLRHHYIRRVEFNPTYEDMAPYHHIVYNLARKTFSLYKNIFDIVGMDYNDLVNTGKVHLVSYIGLFAIERQSEEKQKAFTNTFYEKNGRDAVEVDYLNKNKANFTLFLKQRMEEVVRVCRQKARNIKGLPTEEFYAFYSKNRPPFNINDLVENYEKLGFKKIEVAAFKSIKKKANCDGLIFKYQDTYYVSVPIEHRNLNLVDFTSSDYDPYDNLHNMTPEDLLVISENDKKFDDQKVLFDQLPKEEKVNKIKNFLKQNENNPKLKKEVFLAKKYLRGM